MCEVNCPLIYTHAGTVPGFWIKYPSANLFKPSLNKKLCEALSWKILAPRELKPSALFALQRTKWIRSLLPNWLVSFCPAEKLQAWPHTLAAELCGLWHLHWAQGLVFFFFSCLHYSSGGLHQNYHKNESFTPSKVKQNYWILCCIALWQLSLAKQN